MLPFFSWIVGGGHYYCRCSTQLNPTTNGSIVSIMTPGRYAREVLQVCRVSHHFLWHCKVLHGTDTIVVILSDRCDTSVGWNNHYDVRSSLRSFQCNGVWKKQVCCASEKLHGMVVILSAWHCTGVGKLYFPPCTYSVHCTSKTLCYKVYSCIFSNISMENYPLIA